MINDVFYKIYPVEEINDIEKNKYSNPKQIVNNKIGHRVGHKFGHRFRRSTVVYSFIDYIVKNVNLINCVSDEFKTE
jgi:hypothetical protein